MSLNPTTGGPYRCEDCGRAFPTARELREHEEQEEQQAGVGIGRGTGRDEER